jgi:hypothetical protein
MFKKEYSSWGWIKSSILACWCFGCGNALMGVLAHKFGLYGIILLSVG